MKKSEAASDNKAYMRFVADKDDTATGKPNAKAKNAMKTVQAAIKKNK